MTSECGLGAKKWIKYQNNVRNVFRDIKLPLGNDMGHWNGIFWSLWKKFQKKITRSQFLGGFFAKITKIRHHNVSYRYPRVI